MSGAQPQHTSVNVYSPPTSPPRHNPAKVAAKGKKPKLPKHSDSNQHPKDTIPASKRIQPRPKQAFTPSNPSDVKLKVAVLMMQHTEIPTMPSSVQAHSRSFEEYLAQVTSSPTDSELYAPEPIYHNYEPVEYNYIQLANQIYEDALLQNRKLEKELPRYAFLYYCHQLFMSRLYEISHIYHTEAHHHNEDYTYLGSTPRACPIQLLLYLRSMGRYFDPKSDEYLQPAPFVDIDDNGAYHAANAYARLGHARIYYNLLVNEISQRPDQPPAAATFAELRTLLSLRDCIPTNTVLLCLLPLLRLMVICGCDTVAIFCRIYKTFQYHF